MTKAHKQSGKTIKFIIGPIDGESRKQLVLEKVGHRRIRYFRTEQVDSKIFKGTNKIENHHNEDNPT